MTLLKLKNLDYSLKDLPPITIMIKSKRSTISGLYFKSSSKGLGQYCPTAISFPDFSGRWLSLVRVSILVLDVSIGVLLVLCVILVSILVLLQCAGHSSSQVVVTKAINVSRHISRSLA